jgi:MFS family permease
MAQPDAELPYAPRVQAWWAVAVFFLASIVSVVDRGILALLVAPIRHDLAISDVQIGLLQGLSFGLFYAVVGLPLGLFSDRFSRRWLMIGGIAVWSVATCLGGLASNFGQLFAARMLVGLGEATLAPCAVSIITDLFPSNRRGRPLSIYLLGQAIASGLAVLLTGWILGLVGQGAFRHLAGLGGLAGWRIVFLLCGASGLVVLGLMLTMPEVQRRGAALGGRSSLGLGASWAFLRRNAAVMAPVYLGFAVSSLGSYGLGAWSATYLIRTFHLSASQVGRDLGPASIVAGALGAILAGVMLDHASRSGHVRSKLKLAVFLPLISLPVVFLATATSPMSAVLVIAILTAAVPTVGATVVAILQDVVPADMRGLAVSLCGFFNTIIGAVFGPLLIAMVTEKGLHNAAFLNLGIPLVIAPAAVVAALLFLCAALAIGRRPISHDVALTPQTV